MPPTGEPENAMTLALLITLKLSLAATPPAPQVEQVPDVYDLPDEHFFAQAKLDLAALKRYAHGLRRIQEQLKRRPDLFVAKETETIAPERKRALLSAWGAFYAYVVSVESIRQRYWGFLKVPLSQGKRHAFGFLLTHGALTTELAHGLTFAQRTAGKRQLEVLLDEPNAEFGLPPRAYAQLREKVIHVSTTTQLFTGDAYRVQLLPVLKKSGLLDDPEVVWLTREMRLNSQAARDRLRKQGGHLFAQSAMSSLRLGTMTALFPIQRSVAEWMGDTRIRRIGQPLIRLEQVEALLPKLEPGDVLVARQNWYLSNIGLPGFWPHAELYASTPAELAAYFDDDPAVSAFLATLPGKPATLADYLKSRFPAKWQAYAWGKDLLGGTPNRIIEAISEGVAFTSVHHGMRVDYLGVMRPRLPKVEKARALIRAFEYQGRPYDFDFDFFSDRALVCTELVYKSYAPSANMKGLQVPLVEVAGRMTLPANELVRLFDREYGRPDRQLDFVAFLDGRESEETAVLADAEAFRASHQRLKWDIAQK